MASASTTEVFNCSVEEFYKIISDYSKYSEFLDEVDQCKVIESKDSTKIVEYKINLIKKFSYTMKMDESKAPNELHWHFTGGDLFKESKGSWILKDEAGRCRATYNLEASFGMFVPGPVSKALISVNLPNMMSAFKKRVYDTYGK